MSRWELHAGRWIEGVPSTAQNRHQAYLISALTAVTVLAVLVLMGYFSRKNKFPLNEKVAPGKVDLIMPLFLTCLNRLLSLPVDLKD